MKPFTLALGLSILALSVPQSAQARRLRPAEAPLQKSSAVQSWSDDEFARLDLDALPPPGASASHTAQAAAPSGGMSWRLSQPRADVLEDERVPAAPEPRRSVDSGPRFDIFVNNAPAAQVFLQMGAGAGVNVLVPPEVKGNVTLSLRSVNLAEALEAMRELYGYDFKQLGNRVYVYPNTVQTRIYQVNYLAAQRDGGSSLKVSTPGRSGKSSTGTTSTTSGTSSTSGGAGNSTSDAAKVQMTTSADFWRDLQSSLKELLGGGVDRSVVVNPGGGVLVVRCSPAEHRQVAEYLKALRMSVERQVMLEAKIVEVTLSTEAQSGVNWSLFRSNPSGSRSSGLGIVGAGNSLKLGANGTLASGDVSFSTDKDSGNRLVQAVAGGKGFYGLALQAGNFAALLNFLESQGDVQVLSSPRIATLNNQKAVLKVGADAYFPVDLGGANTTSGTTGTSTTTATPPSVDPMFSGIVLDVTPRVDASGAILLHVHPIISDITLESVTYGLAGQNVNGNLPRVTVSETDSIVRVQDRQIVAIGGLMRESTTKSKSGLTGLSDLPLIGGLFRQKAASTTKRELVVLIKPTVIGDDGEGFEHEAPSPAVGP